MLHFFYNDDYSIDVYNLEKMHFKCLILNV